MSKYGKILRIMTIPKKVFYYMFLWCGLRILNMFVAVANGNQIFLPISYKSNLTKPNLSLKMSVFEQVILLMSVFKRVISSKLCILRLVNTLFGII